MSRKVPLLLAVLIVFFLILSSCVSGPSPERPGEGELPVDGTQSPDLQQPEGPPPEDAAQAIEDVYRGAADSQRALDVLEEVGVAEMDRDSRLVYASLLRTEGRLDESRRILEEILTEDQGFAEAWFNLALTEHAAQNIEARDASLEMCLEHDENHAAAWAMIGTLASSAENWPRAEEAFAAALNIQPDSVEALLGQAWVMARTEREEAALPLLDRAVDLAPDYAYARVDRSRVLVTLRRYGDAEDDLSAAIETEPDVPWHYLDRARIRIRYFKNLEGALEDLERVEELDPGNFFAMVYLAGVHDEERRFNQAGEYYRRAVEMRPDYVWAYRPLGKIAWIQGRYDEAEGWFLTAAREEPEEFSYLVLAGLARLKQGDVPGGRELLGQALRLFETDETGYEVMRFCLEQGSDFYAVNALNSEANEVLRERLWFYMGVIYEIEGNEVGARAVMSRLADRLGEIEFDMAWAAVQENGGAS